MVFSAYYFSLPVMKEQHNPIMNLILYLAQIKLHNAIFL